MKQLLNDCINTDIIDITYQKNAALLEFIQTNLKALVPTYIEAQSLLEIFDFLAKEFDFIYLAKYKSPFLWSCLLHSVLYGEDQLSQHSLQLILLNIFDSYFELLPPACFYYNANADIDAYLPNINIKIKLNKGINVIAKTNNTNISITNNSEQQNYTLSTKNNEIPLRNDFTKCHRSLSNVEIADKYLDMIDECGGHKKNIEKLLKALLYIEAADSFLMEEIKSLIYYFVPLKDIDNYSSSYSLSAYIGIAFISFNTDTLAIAENIMREYCNNLLYLASEYQPFIISNEKLYYSPWHVAPVSINILLFSIYIFVMVISFFSKCLTSSFFKHEEKLLKERLIIQLNRLQVAFLQIDEGELSNVGKKLLNRLHVSFAVINQKYISKPVPDIILQHLKVNSLNIKEIENQNIVIPNEWKNHLMDIIK